MYKEKEKNENKEEKNIDILMYLQNNKN